MFSLPHQRPNWEPGWWVPDDADWDAPGDGCCAECSWNDEQERRQGGFPRPLTPRCGQCGTPLVWEDLEEVVCPECDRWEPVCGDI